MDFIEVGERGYSFWLPADAVKVDNSRIIYSFGVGENVSFDEKLLEDKGVSLWAFDPTPKAIRFIENHSLNQNDRFHFFPYGLSDIDGEVEFFLPVNDEYVSGSVVAYSGVNIDNRILVPMRRLITIMKENGHKVIDLLKLDIEGSEFKVLPDIIRSGIRPEIICVELHERFFPDPFNIKGEFISLMRSAGYIDYGFGEEYLFCLK